MDGSKERCIRNGRYYIIKSLPETDIVNMKTLIAIVILTCTVFAGLPLLPDGFEGAAWGSSPDIVRNASAVTGWQTDASANDFPKELNVTVYRGQTKIAGYPASVKYYFWQNRFFQATVQFEFNDLKNFDFNYNVYRSVNDYYNTIRSKTLTFVFDIYDLLLKKYGRKEPLFKGLDPRTMFSSLDKYLKQETWNLRYHPYDYYQHIIAAAYAYWDFPKTRMIFSVNISAPDKRFDYQLCAASLDLEKQVNTAKDSLRMKGL
jgi:hypothetical protein